LPDDLKTVVQAELRKIEDEHFARHAPFNKESLDNFVKNGMTVYTAPPAELEKVFAKNNVDAVFDSWYALNQRSGTDGRALVTKIQELKAKMELRLSASAESVPGTIMNPDDLRRALAMIEAAGEEALNAAGPEEAINALARAYIDLLGDREAHLKPGALKP